MNDETLFPEVIRRAKLPPEEQRYLAEELGRLLRQVHQARQETAMAGLGILNWLSPVPDIPQLRQDPALGCWAYALLVTELFEEAADGDPA